MIGAGPYCQACGRLRCTACFSTTPLGPSQRDILIAVGNAIGWDGERCSLVECAKALTTERDALKAQLAEALKSCPCVHTTPCHERCTCVTPLSSSGCWRCCSYGSPEQQRAKAEMLASLQSHYDRAAPEHNLLALLDLYEERERKAKEERDHAIQLSNLSPEGRATYDNLREKYSGEHYDALKALRDERDRMLPVYEAAIEFAATLLPDPGRVSPQLATLLDRASSHVRERIDTALTRKEQKT